LQFKGINGTGGITLTNGSSLLTIGTSNIPWSKINKTGSILNDIGSPTSAYSFNNQRLTTLGTPTTATDTQRANTIGNKALSFYSSPTNGQVLTYNGTNSTAIWKSLPSSMTQSIPPSYLIYKSGSAYYAENGTTGLTDFSSTNASSVVQNAQSNLPSSGGKIVFGSGIFPVKIIVQKSQTIFEGQGFTTELTRDGDKKIFDITGNAHSIINIGIKNMWVNGDPATDVTDCIYAKETSLLKIEDIKMSHCDGGNGIYAEELYDSYIKNIDLEFSGKKSANKAGIYLYGGNSDNTNNVHIFNSVFVTQNGTDIISEGKDLAHANYMINIDSSRFESHNSDVQYHINFTNTRSSVISNNHIESALTSNVFLNSNAVDIKILGNFFRNNLTPNAPNYNIDSQGIRSVIISNRFETSVIADINVNDPQSATDVIANTHSLSNGEQAITGLSKVKSLVDDKYGWATPNFIANMTSGNVGISSTKKFFFDGTNDLGDTYISESGANRLDIYTQGQNIARITHLGLGISPSIGGLTPNTGEILHGETNNTVALIRLDSYNNNPTFQGRSTTGTQNTPTATTLDKTLAAFSGAGYDGSAFTGGRAIMFMDASQTFNSTAQGSYVLFQTTPKNTLTPTNAFRINSDQNIGITPNTKICFDALDCSGNDYIISPSNGNVTLFSAGHQEQFQNKTGTIALLSDVTGGTISGSINAGHSTGSVGVLAAPTSSLIKGRNFTGTTPISVTKTNDTDASISCSTCMTLDTLQTASGSKIFTGTINFQGSTNQFKNSTLLVENNAQTFATAIGNSAQYKNNTAQIPLILGTKDTFGLLNTTQTWLQKNTYTTTTTNAAINLGNPSQSTPSSPVAGDLYMRNSILAFYTSAERVVLTDSQVQTISAAKTWQGANLYTGTNNFVSGKLLVENPAKTFDYNFAGSAIIANRTLTLPLTTQSETVAVQPTLNFTSPANQTGTTSTSFVMYGGYATFTPKVTGRLDVTVSGYRSISIICFSN